MERKRNRVMEGIGFHGFSVLGGNIVFHRGEKIKLRYEVSFIFPQNRGKGRKKVTCSQSFLTSFKQPNNEKTPILMEIF